jgi:hypothetical protein
MDPREIRDRLVPEIQDALMNVAAGYAIRDLGEELEKLSEWLQAVGISYLLTAGDQERFRESLVRSAHARRYFLRKSRDTGNDQDPRLALGRTEAFLDALAAGHLALANEIGDLSGDVWHANWEYEDDFYYYLFLHRILPSNNAAGRASLFELLTRFERALQGADAPRLDVCKALFDRDNGSLREAIHLLMEARKTEMRKAWQRNLERDADACVYWARGLVSIEGLAVLRIAEVTGLAPLGLDEEEELCPWLAIVPVVDHEYVDIFSDIEAELLRSR